jgi:hypothetical protein
MVNASDNSGALTARCLTQRAPVSHCSPTLFGAFFVLLPLNISIYDNELLYCPLGLCLSVEISVKVGGSRSTSPPPSPEQRRR